MHLIFLCKQPSQDCVFRGQAQGRRGGVLAGTSLSYDQQSTAIPSGHSDWLGNRTVNQVSQ
jgi:hypothetical protein